MYSALYVQMFGNKNFCLDLKNLLCSTEASFVLLASYVLFGDWRVGVMERTGNAGKGIKKRDLPIHFSLPYRKFLWRRVDKIHYFMINALFVCSSAVLCSRDAGLTSCLHIG